MRLVSGDLDLKTAIDLPIVFQEPKQDTQLQTNGQTCDLIKCSMLYGAHKYPQLEAAVASHRRHSERWNCGFRNLEYDLTSRKMYSKEYFVLSTILEELAKPDDQRKEWVMWADADSIILNPALSPEVFLPPQHLKEVFALVTADREGLNAGVFYLRVHAKSVDLLTQTVAYPLDYPDVDLGWFGEQAAMANVIKAMEAGPQPQEQYPEIAWLPHAWFNAYQSEDSFEGQPGDMLVHFAGLGATRLSHMQKWLEEIKHNTAKWEIPLDQTIYNEAIPEFWKAFEKNGTLQQEATEVKDAEA
jgi:hypothetical protein